MKLITAISKNILTPMKTLLITLTLVSLTCFSANASAAEERLHETRPAKPGGKLQVDVEFGSITVIAGDNEKVVIDAYRKVEGASKEKDEAYLAAAPITVTTEGDKIIVRAIRRHESLGRQLWDMMGNWHSEGRYNISVPANFQTDLDTSGGSISVTGLIGTVKADTSGGHLTFERIHGDIHADTSGGSITTRASEGAIDLDTSGGHIEVTDSRGTLRADTSGGNVTVLNFAGPAKIDSSGGKLRLANIGGKLHAETSGGAISAILPSPVPDDIHLETSAGAITVLTPSNAALTVDAETSSGHVRSDLPLSSTQADDDSLKGKINGGGKKLVLRSGAGAIEIVSADRTTAQSNAQ
jgi:hypothetical protein